MQSLIKRRKDHQVQILDTFSKKSWEKLSLDKKNAHSLFNCNGCLKDKKLKGTLGLFPVKSVAYKQKQNKKMAYWIRYYVTSPIKQSKNWTLNSEKILTQVSLIK